VAGAPKRCAIQRQKPAHIVHSRKRRRPLLIRFKEWWREDFPDCNEAIASSAIKPSARGTLPSTMAAMNKSLAQKNKSRTGGKTTKKRNPNERVARAAPSRSAVSKASAAQGAFRSGVTDGVHFCTKREENENVEGV